MTAEAETQTAGLERLYHLHRAELLRFLTARTGNPAEAEEVIQDLWLKLQSARVGPVSNGRAYLYRMAQNLVLDRVREHRRRLMRDREWSDQERGRMADAVEILDTSPTAETQMETRQEITRLMTAILALPEGARRAFQMHKIDGLSHGEVAARLGISKSGVEKHMAVAMKFLRQTLLE